LYVAGTKLYRSDEGKATAGIAVAVSAISDHRVAEYLEQARRAW
jgi:hypothetical protein